MLLSFTEYYQFDMCEKGNDVFNAVGVSLPLKASFFFTYEEETVCRMLMK